MRGYNRGTDYHTGFGTLGGPMGLQAVIEPSSFFAARALGPIIRSNGYPSPATLPPSIGGGAMGYGASGGGLSMPLIIGLIIVSAIGIAIVHHLHWRA